MTLEAIVHFPWRGGRHPCLDVLIVTNGALIGVESKRYEPFRAKGADQVPDTYSRDVFGDKMSGYQRCLEGIRSGEKTFTRLDAAQLVKHAFALRTAVHRVHCVPDLVGKQPVLFYLYSEPVSIADPLLQRHRKELDIFANEVEGDEVSFCACTYSNLLTSWASAANLVIRAHAAEVTSRYSIRPDF